MSYIFGTSIEDTPLTVEFDYVPAEEATRDCPGWTAEAYITRISVQSDKLDLDIFNLVSDKVIDKLEECCFEHIRELGQGDHDGEI